MDLGTALIGAIFLAVCMVPFIIMYYYRVKKENKIVQSLKKIAQQQNCNIDKYEFCGDFALGVDENRGFVFFYKQKNEETIRQFVNLSGVQTCQVVKKTRNQKANKTNELVTTQVELCFTSTNKNNDETRFELYDEEVNTQLSGELQFAESWAKQITERLKSKK